MFGLQVLTRSARKNLIWLISEKSFRMSVGMVMTALVARSLGPEQFGLLSYTIAFVSLFSAFASLGAEGMIVRDLLEKTEQQKHVLASALFLRFISGFVGFLVALIAYAVYKKESGSNLLIVGFIGTIFFFQAAEPLEYWFQSRSQIKQLVVPRIIGFITATILKIVLVLSSAGLIYFAAAHALESAFIALAVFFSFFFQRQRPQLQALDLSYLLKLAERSWPLTISGLAIMIYMRIDQIMLESYLGNKAVGIYSSALMLSEIWYFLPVLLAKIISPTLVSLRIQKREVYEEEFVHILKLTVRTSLVIAILISLFSHELVEVFFGSNYSAASAVLTIHVWTGLFVGIGVLSGIWLINEGLEKFAMYRTLTGGIVNIVLNAILIPSFGIVGAAFATLLAQITATFAVDYFSVRTRQMFDMKVSALRIV